MREIYVFRGVGHYFQSPYDDTLFSGPYEKLADMRVAREQYEEYMATTIMPENWIIATFGPSPLIGVSSASQHP